MAPGLWSGLYQGPVILSHFRMGVIIFISFVLYIHEKAIYNGYKIKVDLFKLLAIVGNFSLA